MLSTTPKSIEHAIFRIPFEGPRSEIPAKDVVGSKAHNLMRIAASNLPVPPGFVVSADLCRRYIAEGGAVLAGLEKALERELEWLGTVTGRRFGDSRRPLLVSVRSGAAVSMPGMMETILNIGLSDTAISGMVRMTGNPRLAQDCRRRLIEQYGEVVHKIPAAKFSAKVTEALATVGAASIDELATSDLSRLSAAFEGLYESEVGAQFPNDVVEQLCAAVESVLVSWSSDRARSYRKLNSIPDSLGTAVTVQTMVFGNIGPTSGAGVGFTRNPASGSNELYVDFLPNAQGEDVVAGRQRAAGLEELERRAPGAYRALVAARDVLEREFRDMQDFEFTVEEGRLLLLQARSGKRTSLAALKIAHDLVAEAVLSPSEALSTLAGLNIDEIEDAGLQLSGTLTPLVTGTSAGLGVAVGKAVFDPDRVAEVSKGKQTVILIRPTAETAEVAALSAAAGLITTLGARTSHAAVVARQLGKPCIVACSGLLIDPAGRHAMIGAERISEGDLISMDASGGFVFKGELETVHRRPSELIAEVQRWQKEVGLSKRFSNVRSKQHR